MAKKTNTKADDPQQNAGATTTTEQPNATAQKPDEIAGGTAGDGAGTAPVVNDQPGAGSQANENTAGAATGAAGETEHPNPARAASDTAEETATKAKTKKAAEPKVSDAVVEIGKGLLKSNPEMSVVHMTADGRGFYEKNDAELHARTLTNKAVTPVTR